jgi:putative flippase GtrA
MLRREIIRFGAVGGAATITHLMAAAVFTKLFRDLDAVGINTLAFCVAFIVSYAGHRYVTFGKEGSPAKFFITSLTGLAINNAVVYLASSIVEAKLLAITIGTMIAPIAVFFLSKYWVFRAK